MWRTILGTREGRIGVPLGTVMVIVIAVGRFVAPYPPDKIGVAIPESPPSGAHLLGADAGCGWFGLGRAEPVADRARPALLLCDEVTSALDVSIQATILELIAQLAATFANTVVFVSYDLAVVRTICRHAVVMRAGRICEEGPTGELFMAPRHPYTRELIAAIPSLPTATSHDRAK